MELRDAIATSAQEFTIMMADCEVHEYFFKRVGLVTPESQVKVQPASILASFDQVVDKLRVEPANGK
jgi:hypothetical protein